MITELRRYRIKPDRLDSWLTFFAEVIRESERHGIRVEYAGVDRETSTFFWLRSFADEADRETRPSFARVASRRPSRGLHQVSGAAAAEMPRRTDGPPRQTANSRRCGTGPRTDAERHESPIRDIVARAIV